MRNAPVVLVTIALAFFCLLLPLATATELRWSESFPSGDVGSTNYSEVRTALVFDEDGPGGEPAALFAAHGETGFKASRSSRTVTAPRAGQAGNPIFSTSRAHRGSSCSERNVGSHRMWESPASRCS